MKFSTIFLLSTTLICSTLGFPATGGHPDDDAEFFGEQPNVQDNSPEYPSIPSYPVVPNYNPVGQIPTVPVLPNYPTYTYGYIPLGWTYSFLDNFSNLVQRLGNQVSNSWSRLPLIRPIVQNYWPDVKTNGTKTSTVKVVGDHKFIINETVHVQESTFGHVVFRTKTVDIKPLTEGDTTESSVVHKDSKGSDGSDDDANRDRESNDDETNESDRESVTEEGETEIDDNVDIDGNSESFNDENELSRNYSRFENSESIESTEQIEEIKPISIKRNEQYEIESLSAEISETEKPREWYDIEIETNNHDNENNHPSNTYYSIEKNYEKNSDEDSGEMLLVPVDLSNDIAINEMLADQGGIHDPDAEIFDIHQYEMNAHIDETKSTFNDNKDTKPESFDYLPYHHTAVQRPSIK